MFPSCIAAVLRSRQNGRTGGRHFLAAFSPAMAEEIDPWGPPIVVAPIGTERDLWVFGYGSLMWRPGFPYLEAHPALLRGWHRSLCVYSHHHRGTAARPGLVLGLDRGGACRGVAFRVADAEAETTRAYLIEREQVTLVYREIASRVRLDDGRTVQALTFVVDRGHHQYAGILTPERQAELIRSAQGVSGRNIDYLESTLRHLEELRVRDGRLMDVARHLPLPVQAEPDPTAAPEF